MLDMAKSKGWELDSIKVTGSKAFCDEVAKQIAEIKAKEKAEQEQKLKELTKLNEPKPSQQPTQHRQNYGYDRGGPSL